MRKKWSKIAYNIDKEYKQEQVYKKIKRQRCKEVECYKCKWNLICEDKEDVNGDNQNKYK